MLYDSSVGKIDEAIFLYMPGTDSNGKPLIFEHDDTYYSDEEEEEEIIDYGYC